MTDFLLLVLVVQLGVIQWWLTTHVLGHLPTAPPPLPPAGSSLSHAQQLRAKEVKETIRTLDEPTTCILRKLVITDGLLARHIRAELAYYNYSSSPEWVETIKQHLLDANLVCQDVENRIYIRGDVKAVAEGMLVRG
jgi:hypothetical protein